eukprot:TRINITY_DN1700_c0_g1_i2.p3 TRINITY_DN1700_c0_g1~~TRINITY_DN1700_c0_g1_i2.p3  ORF type:complete len:122 (-),score=15.70 TRINITY_DN1700_c0_g1_i2:27-392(-)
MVLMESYYRIRRNLFLRKYGVPTKLNKGVVECLADHVVCTEGQKLDHKQVAVLGIFQQKMAISKLVLMARWDKQTCEYTSLVADEDLEDDDMNQSQFGDEFQIDVQFLISQCSGEQIRKRC